MRLRRVKYHSVHRQVCDRCSGISHRNGRASEQPQDHDSKAGDSRPNSTSSQGSGTVQDHCGSEDQDHNAEDEVAWPAVDRSGVSDVVRWRASRQRQADQGQHEGTRTARREK